MDIKIYTDTISEEDLEYARERLLDLPEFNEENVGDYVYSEAQYVKETWFDDEMYELNKQLDGKIICIGTIGRWNGIVTGYRIMGNNLNEILSRHCDGAYSDLEVFADRWNVQATEAHHDGRNYYLYRELRMDTNYQNLLDAIIAGKSIKKILNKYTKSLKPHIQEIYGF